MEVVRPIEASADLPAPECHLRPPLGYSPPALVAEEGGVGPAYLPGISNKCFTKPQVEGSVAEGPQPTS